MIDGWKFGSKFGMLIANLSAKIYWMSHRLRRWKYYRLYIADRTNKFKFLKEFVGGFKAHHQLSFVKCETCGAVGIDHNSEKHGWKYEGSHIWSCPKCKEKNGAIV